MITRLTLSSDVTVAENFVYTLIRNGGEPLVNIMACLHLVFVQTAQEFRLRFCPKLFWLALTLPRPHAHYFFRPSLFPIIFSRLRTRLEAVESAYFVRLLDDGFHKG